MAVTGRKLLWLVKKLGMGKKLARRGCFAVYVGENRVRREIPTKYLGSTMLQELLNQCRDEVDEGTNLCLGCSLRLLDSVLELAKAEVEETSRNLTIKNEGITLSNRRQDQLDKRTGLYLCRSPGLLYWVLEPGKAEEDEADPDLAIKRDGIVHVNMLDTVV